MGLLAKYSAPVVEEIYLWKERSVLERWFEGF
jgi:hypothetical protein